MGMAFLQRLRDLRWERPTCQRLRDLRWERPTCQRLRDLRWERPTYQRLRDLRWERLLANGFAAGCEATAMPRRYLGPLHRAAPLVRASPATPSLSFQLGSMANFNIAPASGHAAEG